MRLTRQGVVSGAVLVLVSTGALAQSIPERPSGDRQPVGPSEPRVAPLPETAWTDTHRGLVARFGSREQVSNQLATLLNVPEIAEAVMPLTVYLTEASTLTQRQRHLLTLRTAWLCGNQPLWATHAADARDAGLADDEIRRIAVGPQAVGWDPFEQALLEMADQLYRNSSVADATWEAVRARFDQRQMMDAVETVNHFVVLSLMYNSFGVQPDVWLTDRLPTDVPYEVIVPDREPPLREARVEPLEGDGIAVSRTFAHHPALVEARRPRAGFINRVSRLTPRHREMLILRIGWDCQAEYEWAKHVGSVGRARDHGVDPVVVARGPETPGIDPFDAGLLRAVDELYRDAVVSDETWALLTERFDTALTMSAVLTPSSYRATSMSLNAYGVQLEPGDEEFPVVNP